MLPSARMLVHYIRHRKAWVADDPELLERDIDFFRKEMLEVRERRFSLYESRTGLSRGRLLEIFRYGEIHGSSFSAQQAVELGFADEVLRNFKLFSKEPVPEKLT